MKFWTYIFAGTALVFAGFSAVYLLGNHPGGERTDLFSAATWERMATPGALSRAHTFLEHNCAACHTKADEGSFREGEIRIPGRGRWGD